MNQSRQERSRLGAGMFRSALVFSVLLTASTCGLSGCGDGGGSEGMLDEPKDVTKTPDAQDSMKSYMKSMQSKGMKPGMKTSAKTGG
jgi:hypothetical protein